MSYSSVVLADSPVSYWPLADSGSVAIDLSDSNNGTYHGGATSSSSSYPLATCILFDGSTGYMDVPDSTNLHLTGVTMEAWVKTTSANTQDILNKTHQGPPVSGYAMAVGQGSVGVVGVWAGTGSWLTGLLKVNDGNWHHIVGTISSGGEVKTYVDTVLELDTTISPVLAGTKSLNVGRNSFSASEFFNGSMMHVAVYNSVLTQDQIKNHFAAVGDTGLIRDTQLPIRVISQSEAQRVRETQLPVRTIVQPQNEVRATQVAIRVLKSFSSDGPPPACIVIRKNFNNRSLASPIDPTL